MPDSMTEITAHERYPDAPAYISPDFRISVQEFEYQNEQTVKKTARLYNEFFWVRVMEGELCFEVDGSLLYVRSSETLFINSSHFHTFRGISKAPACFRIIAAMPDAVSTPPVDSRIEKMVRDDSFSSIVIRPVSELFSYELDAIFDLNRHHPDAWEFEVAAHYLQMLRQIYRIYRHTNPDDTIRRSIDLQSLRKMLGFIGENFRDEITLDQIAAAGRMSRSRCTRVFRRYLQESPIEHVQKYRLERSVYLINNTDLQFSEIAGKCGFNQQSYFNRLFVRNYGMTPKQMRAESLRARGTAENESSAEK